MGNFESYRLSSIVNMYYADIYKKNLGGYVPFLFFFAFCLGNISGSNHKLVRGVKEKK